jgi:hypothetical protein
MVAMTSRLLLVSLYYSKPLHNAGLDIEYLSVVVVIAIAAPFFFGIATLF